jgi:hypothetical protein
MRRRSVQEVGVTAACGFALAGSKAVPAPRREAAILMDVESAKLPPIRQASEDDLRDAFAEDFGAAIALVRNYGDRLEASAASDDRYRVAYYDAVSGLRQQAEALLSREQVKDAFFDYFQGNWNWHQGHAWRTIDE